ncbi:MAG TPA: hypothetical protein VJN88_01720 [Ktedonobacterales bacterium]|nr:hypothetical protein [Ktedonobacterales bacterium]
MRKRFLRLVIAFIVLTGGSASYVLVGANLYQRYHLAYQNYHFVPAGSCGPGIGWSPPNVLYSGLYTNQTALVFIRFHSPTPQTWRITVGIPHFTLDQTLQVQVAAAFQSVAFKPPIADATVLDTLLSTGDQNAEIHLRVVNTAGTICDTTSALLMKSRQWMLWQDPSRGANAPLLAGWVTPQSPAVAQLVGRASEWLQQRPATYPATTALHGYDAGRASLADVRGQVNALFDTLQNVYHMHYAQDNIVYSGEQRIQLPSDLLGDSAPTGMCVETTVLLASAIERLGMRPYLILAPGHAFLGVALGVAANAPIAYWETSDLNGGVTGSQANRHGDDEYAVDVQQGTLTVIDVQFERAQGVEPME